MLFLMYSFYMKRLGLKISQWVKNYLYYIYKESLFVLYIKNNKDSSVGKKPWKCDTACVLTKDVEYFYFLIKSSFFKAILGSQGN